MEIEFIAGFGPVSPDPAGTFEFWSGDLGIAFDEIAPDYHHARDLDGARVLALWPLSQAAEATFGTPDWPTDLPVPQAWIELEVGSPSEVAAGIEELRSRGHRILAEAHEEPWGQTTGRLLSPEGLLLGLSYMPEFHLGEQSPAVAAVAGPGKGADDLGAQRIPMRASYAETIRSGRKLQTIRVDGPFATGPSLIVFDDADAAALPPIPVEVMGVRRTTVGELTDVDARADGYDDLDSFLAALRTHAPDLTDADVLDVVVYRLSDPA